MASQRGRREARPNRHVRGGKGKRGPALELSELLAERPEPFLLVLDGVQDPHNLGAILRSADGAGVDGVIAPKDRAVGITETVRRISVGAADRVPFLQVANLARTLDELREAGVWLVGTSDRAEQNLYEVGLTGPLALVMGAEEKGLRRLTEEKCDHLVKIPMCGRVECLNVSVATGVCLFEAVRQRGHAGKTS
jgi:23S rRNA (guanosine2251-2'-O)-methyltransferase